MNKSEMIRGLISRPLLSYKQEIQSNPIAIDVVHAVLEPNSRQKRNERMDRTRAQPNVCSE